MSSILYHINLFLCIVERCKIYLVNHCNFKKDMRLPNDLSDLKNNLAETFGSTSFYPYCSGNTGHSLHSKEPPLVHHRRQSHSH